MSPEYHTFQFPPTGNNCQVGAQFLRLYRRTCLLLLKIMCWRSQGYKGGGGAINRPRPLPSELPMSWKYNFELYKIKHIFNLRKDCLYLGLWNCKLLIYFVSRRNCIEAAAERLARMAKVRFVRNKNQKRNFLHVGTDAKKRSFEGGGGGGGCYCCWTLDSVGHTCRGKVYLLRLGNFVRPT
jgi:hypothetical protein